MQAPLVFSSGLVYFLQLALLVLFVSLPYFQPASALHVSGRWNPDQEFFLFLAKFGFQKTELTNKNDTQGFIFGNITSNELASLAQVISTKLSAPGIPPEALVPKVRVPRGVLPLNSTTTKEQHGAEGNSSNNKANNTTSISSGLTNKPNASAVAGTSKNVSFISSSTTTSSTTTSTVPSIQKEQGGSPSPPPKPAEHQPPKQNQSMVSETFVNPSKSPLPPAHVNFSSRLSSSSRPEVSVSSASIPVSTPSASSSTTSSTTSTTTTAAPAVRKETSSSSRAPASSIIKPSSTVSSTSSGVSTSSTKKSTTTVSTPTPLPAPPSPTPPATLVVLDKGFFIDFYKSRPIQNRDEACKRMFERISHVTRDPYCFPEGTENFLKRVPCPKDGVCWDDLVLNQSVVKGHQFTYAISDLSKAKFWYISLVPCFRNPVTCEWEYSKNASSIDYDIWLVNGNPYTKNQNPLEYQFSFDRQDTVEIYLVFFLCYLILVPLQIHAVLRQRHIVPKLFTASVALELTAVTSNVIHVLKFALDGEGHPRLAAFGDVMDIIARAIFMLILLVLAKGWAVTRTELTSKPFIFSIWAVYGIVHILLYVWKGTEVDVIEDIDEYQTWPGWMILILRTLIMIWFLYELKDTMDHEHTPHKLNFFLHFGAAALVWFIYLPIVALIALQVSPLWRSKFLLGITYSADCLAFAIMTHLLWPTRTEQYFLLMSKDAILTDELEEFNEAPHVVNSYVRRPNHWYPVNYSFHDVSSPEAVSLTQGNTLQNLNHQYPHQRFTTGTNSFHSDDTKDNVPLIIT